MIKSRPEGGFWGLKDTDAQSQHYGKTFNFDFSFIVSGEIKDITMDYVWRNYRTGNKAIKSLYSYMKAFKYFNSFAVQRKIVRLKDMTNNDVDNFLSYLRTTKLENSDKPLAYRYQQQCLSVLKNLIYWGQIHDSDAVPDKEIFTGNELPGKNQTLKIEYIPDDVLKKINEALIVEENPYLRYGIVILESTGIRIGDLMLLPVDCIEPHPIDGCMMKWFNHKKHREKPPMPIRRECAVAFERLLEYTKAIREEADDSLKKYLFIRKGKNGKGISRIHNATFGNWLREFAQTHNIVNSDGKTYNLTSHQFRRALGTDMLSKGTNLNVIQQVLDHADPSTTRRFYADVKDRERAKIFKGVGIIGNISLLDESTFNNKEDLKWFQANKDKGACMSDGYCTKPITEGKLCDRLLKRLKCYSCSRYITTPEFLDAHKDHLRSLEGQITENAIYGEHYAEHFRPTIEVLKIIVDRLEALQNADNRPKNN